MGGEESGKRKLDHLEGLEHSLDALYLVQEAAGSGRTVWEGQ